MLIEQHLSPEQILLNVKTADKWELINLLLDTAMAGPMASAGADVQQQAREAVLHREKSYSTGLTDGLAIPHARVHQLHELVLVLAVVPDGVDYGSADGKDVQIALLVLAPEDNPTVSLQVMSAVATLFGDAATREAFLEAENPYALYRFISRHQWSADTPILAREVMRPMLTHIGPDMPLREVTRLMHVHRLNAVAVLDEENHVLGEITADLLFKRGIPDFFNQLPSVSFIRDFNPFEKYFAEEAHAVARDVMEPPGAVVEETATLMEIVYLLSVRKHPKVHVTRDGKKVGTIERSTLLDRILNL